MSKHSGRHSIRLKGFDYSQPFWYFVTICCYHREYLFGKIRNGKMILNSLGIIARDEWENTKIIRPTIDLDYYVIMPNHIHGIVVLNENIRKGVQLYAPTKQYAPTPQTGLETKWENTGKFISPSNTLGAIIRGYKASVTKQINTFRKTPGLQIWQRNYYDRIIRNEKELYRIRRYIELNPFKWYLGEDTVEDIEFD